MTDDDKYMSIKKIFWNNLICKSSHIDKYDHVTYQPMRNLSTIDLIPDEPDFLLPNNFKVYGSIDDIKSIIDTSLPSQCGSSFTSSETTWSGTWVDEYKNWCTFQIRIYKSNKNLDQYIIEGERTGGENFPFKYFFSHIEHRLIEKL